MDVVTMKPEEIAEAILTRVTREWRDVVRYETAMGRKAPKPKGPGRDLSLSPWDPRRVEGERDEAPPQVVALPGGVSIGKGARLPAPVPRPVSCVCVCAVRGSRQQPSRIDGTVLVGALAMTIAEYAMRRQGQVLHVVSNEESTSVPQRLGRGGRDIPPPWSVGPSVRIGRSSVYFPAVARKKKERREASMISSWLTRERRGAHRFSVGVKARGAARRENASGFWIR